VRFLLQTAVYSQVFIFAQMILSLREIYVIPVPKRFTTQ